MEMGSCFFAWVLFLLAVFFLSSNKHTSTLNSRFCCVDLGNNKNGAYLLVESILYLLRL